MNELDEKKMEIEGSWWKGKLWYAYGTSITSAEYGTYVPYLEKLSGLCCVNKGWPGGGLAALGSISRGEISMMVFNEDDGKENADLITLEVGANDIGKTTPLGSIFDNSEHTLCGCLNRCIRKLQSFTKAQIVIIPSPPMKADPVEDKKYYEAELLFQQVAFLNRVWFIPGNSTLAYGRIRDNQDYTVDEIHQTRLGGYNLAQSIWAELKRIPLFYSKLPE